MLPDLIAAPRFHSGVKGRTVQKRLPPLVRRAYLSNKCEPRTARARGSWSSPTARPCKWGRRRRSAPRPRRSNSRPAGPTSVLIPALGPSRTPVFTATRRHTASAAFGLLPADRGSATSTVSTTIWSGVGNAIPRIGRPWAASEIVRVVRQERAHPCALDRHVIGDRTAASARMFQSLTLHVPVADLGHLHRHVLAQVRRVAEQRHASTVRQIDHHALVPRRVAGHCPTSRTAPSSKSFVSW